MIVADARRSFPRVSNKIVLGCATRVLQIGSPVQELVRNSEKEWKASPGGQRAAEIASFFLFLARLR